MPQLMQWCNDTHWSSLAALFAGAVSVLAFAPFELRPFAFLSLALFIFLITQSRSNKHAAWLGLVFGVGHFSTGVYWIFHSLSLFGHAIAPLAAFLTFLFALGMALYPMLFAYSMKRWLVPHNVWVFIGFVASSWTLMEWLRGWLLTGFPWLFMGYTQVDWPLKGLIPVFGALGASWGVAAIAAALAWMLLKPNRRLAAGFIAAIMIVGQLLSFVQWAKVSGEPVRVSMIQGNIPQAEKWLPEMYWPTLRHYHDLTRRHWDSDLIVWPETAVPSYYAHVEDVYLNDIKQEAERFDTELIIGLFYRDQQENKTYNSLVHLSQGEDAFYHKRHLVPFGEYIPMRDTLKFLRSVIKIAGTDLSSGVGSPVRSIAGQEIGLSICYEDAYGVEMMDALPAATMLINATNDAWFLDSLEPYQHMEIGRARALEAGRYLLRATNTGYSGVIASDGRIVAASPLFETHVLTYDVPPMQGVTPFVRWGNWMVISLMLLFLTMSLVFSRRAAG